MDTSAFQAIKLAIVGFTGLSKDALHVHVGMAMFLIVCALQRRWPASLLPATAVLVAALAGEALDLRDDLQGLGYWRWDASLHDVFNTTFWPVMLTWLSRAFSSPRRDG